jgi:tetratricopeptide (TPR) repeat protein
VRGSTRLAIVVAVPLVLGSPLAAQQDTLLSQAQAAYEALDYSSAIRAARQALRGSLGRDEQVAAYELLGYSYGALDSTRSAVEAFQQLIFLAPDREPDVERVSPRITSLYASALGQVLVVRRVAIDSTSFIAGAGAVPIRFEVSRLAHTSVRVIGSGLDIVVDSQTVSGIVRVDWRATHERDRPFPPGDYEIVVTASEGGRSEYASRPLSIRLEHGRLDTLPHLSALPGYQEQPELVSPPRDWRPLAVTILYTGLIGGVFLAVDDRSLGTSARTAMLSVSAAGVATGLVLSLRRPEPRPSSTNLLYNRLLRELLARRNDEIARENSMRQKQVLLTISPAH